MTNETIPNVPRELLEELRDAANESMNATTRQHQIDHFAGLIAKADAILSAPSPAGVDGLEVVSNWVLFDAGADKPYIKKMLPEGFLAFFDCEEDARRAKANNPGTDYKRIDRVKAEDAQAIIDGLRGEAARLREERDSFQRIGIRQIEHRYQLAALLLEKFPRIDPHHPITLSEVDHCCEYVLHKDRERLHCAIDAALSAVCAAAPNIATTSEHSGS